MAFPYKPVREPRPRKRKLLPIRGILDHAAQQAVVLSGAEKRIGSLGKKRKKIKRVSRAVIDQLDGKYKTMGHRSIKIALIKRLRRRGYIIPSKRQLAEETQVALARMRRNAAEANK